MAEPKSFKVGEAPWETGQTKTGAPLTFKVGEAPWEVQQQPAPAEESGVLDAVMAGLKKIDSYTGAPTRSALSAIQNDKSPIEAFGSQFGQNPDLAPTGKQIAEKAGVSGETRIVRTADEQQKFDQLHNPGWAASMKQVGAKYAPVTVTPSEAAGLGIDIAADWTNLIPVVGQAKEALAGTKMGARAIATGEKIAAKAAESAASGAKTFGKRAVSVLFGPDMQSIERYIQRAEHVKNAKSVEEIKNSIDSTMQGLFDHVEKAKLTKEEAKEALQMVKTTIKDTIRDANYEFRVDKADVNETFKAANQNLENAYKGKLQELADVKSPIHLADDVATSIQDIKSKVKQGSEESYKILDQDPNAYSVRGAAPVLRQMADDMNILPFEGTPGGSKGALVPQSQWGLAKPASSAPVTTQSIGVQNELRKFAALLEKTPEKVPARELKKMLQQIDASEMAVYGQPGFDSRVSAAYKTIRRTIDDAIKARNPQYADKMLEVSGNKGLMESAINRFGDSRAATSRLNAIGSRTAEADRQLLAKIGDATGRDFVTPVNHYLEAQGKLKASESLSQIKKALPEYSSARKAESKAQQLARPEAPKQFVEGALKKQSLPEQLAKHEAGFSESTNNLEKAQETLAPFKTVTPHNSESMVRGLMKAPGKENIEIRKTIEGLSKANEKDYLAWIADRRAADQFAGEFRIGSRNVSLWTIMGAMIGNAPGAGIGAVIGAMTDKFGPKMVQKILDGALKLKGAPTASKIMSLKLEPKIEHFLLRELSKASSINERLREVSGPDDSTPKKGKDKWASDGLQKLLDHSADEKVKSKLNENKGAMLKDPKTKDLLIQASDLKPGTKSMDAIMTKIKERVAKEQD